MRYKRYIIILALAVFALSIAGVCASDADDAVASIEETNTLESSADDSIIEIDDSQAIDRNENEEILNEENVGTFSDLRQKILNAGNDTTITLDRDYEDDGTGGIEFRNSNIIIDGAGHKIDAKKQSRIFIVRGINATIKNITFVNANHPEGIGGAILWNGEKGSLSDCTFINNTAEDGGAVYWIREGGIIYDCTFINNTAEDGGAIFWNAGGSGVSQCIFINNKAERSGSAIYATHGIPVYYCWFGNTETDYTSQLPTYGVTCDSWLFLKATSSSDTISVLSSSDILFKLYAYNSTSQSIVDYDNNVFNYFDLEITQTNGIVDAGITKFGKAVRYTATSGGTGVITASSGSYPIASVNVNVKLATGLTSKASVTSYNSGKNLVVTLKDSNGNPVRGAKITVDLNGIKTYTTDKNGQIKVPIFKLVPKAYVAKIKFNGNGAYLDSAKDVKVTVTKAKPKITAKAKSFKKSLKVKKYTVTLKTGKSPVKKVKVTLKIGKKTYTAKTNSKGKATFKIKKLSKKGTYKSKVTFKGDKCYKKVTKTVKIKIK